MSAPDSHVAPNALVFVIDTVYRQTEGKAVGQYIHSAIRALGLREVEPAHPTTTRCSTVFGNVLVQRRDWIAVVPYTAPSIAYDITSKLQSAIESTFRTAWMTRARVYVRVATRSVPEHRRREEASNSVAPQLRARARPQTSRKALVGAVGVGGAPCSVAYARTT